MEELSQRLPNKGALHHDWLHLDHEMVKEQGGSLFRRYSLLELLKNCFPQFFWERIWKFPRYSSSEEKRMFIDNLISNSFAFVEKQLNLNQIDTKGLLHHQRGSTILSSYEYSPYGLFQETYPELIPQYRKVHDYWNRRSIDRFVSSFNFVERKDHFSYLSSVVICSKEGGLSLLAHNNGDLLPLFVETYPELNLTHNGKYPPGYWNRFSIDKLTSRFLDIQTIVHFSKQSFAFISQFPGGASLLDYYKGRIQYMFKEIYPEVVFHRPIYEDVKGRVSLDRLMSHCNYLQNQKDLYALNRETIEGYPGGASMLHVSRGSVLWMLSQFYPELVFKEKISKYWTNFTTNHLIQHTIKHYEIKKKEDWYRVSIKQISQVYGKWVEKKNIMQLLSYWYPEQHWDLHKFADKRNKRARQRDLGLKLLQIFKKEVVLEEHHWKEQENVFAFDFFIPGLKLVIEYQGEQHYRHVYDWLSLHQQHNSDLMKKRVCVDNGLKLIEIPFWWDGSLDHLKSIINQQLTLFNS
eukprot:TRINITY_DN4616_c0_g1_i1.p1 TRINITY_DN4616_c0_g1~~TRINITY_DN4616_c0_g1_i1.p1  ORF type:complete len:601 (+),score=102.86 TRINITY_DN4616_c0_g1_i1:241-1803(+)